MYTVEDSLKKRTWNWLDWLENEQIQNVITYIKALPPQKYEFKSSKTPEEIEKAVKAFEEIEKISAKYGKHYEVIDDKAEIARILKEKYESLN